MQAGVETLTLLVGELALATDTGNIYVGTTDGVVWVNPPSELEDTGVTAGDYTKVTVDEKGRVMDGGDLDADDIPDLTLAKITDAGTAAAANTGTSSGNVPVLDANGKLAHSVMPSLTITDVFVVADEAAMLALDAEQGDIAVRTDTHQTFILTAADATDVDNWIEFDTASDRAPLESPAFTGTPTAPTPDEGDDSESIATTEFVNAAIASATIDGGTF